MTEVKKGVGKAKVGLIICIVLIVILAISNAWLLIRVGSLQSQVDTLETDKDNLQSRVNQLESQVASLQNQISSLYRLLTINSSPSGVTFTVSDATVDGVNHTTPWSETYLAGALVFLEMPETHSVGNLTYYWNQWSDGFPYQARYVIMHTDITLTANYTVLPLYVIWSEDALDYRDNYLWCIQSKTGMPAAFFPEAVALMRCSSEKLANRTDRVVDLIDIRACEVTYMIDAGYYPGTYADCCAALTGWEEACNVPYPIDCSEIVDFINANHDHIAAAIDECSD